MVIMTSHYHVFAYIVACGCQLKARWHDKMSSHAKYVMPARF